MKKLSFVFVCCFCLGSNVLGNTDVTVKKCGTSIFSSKATGRIVGGKYARHGQYPWMVSLHENGGEGFEHVCGAAVLNENWIITASHCIELADQPWKYEILVGLHKQSEQNAKTVQRLKISKIVLHENYNDDTLQNDIALLRTAKPIDIDGSKGYVNGICLPETDEDPTEYATVTGWGHSYQDGQNSNILKEAVVPIIPRGVCNKVYDEDPLDGLDEITETMLCAGMAGRDSCQNDSGGPLIQINKEGIATLIGIVSNGSGCGDKSYPGIYTKVAAFRNWIETVVSK